MCRTIPKAKPVHREEIFFLSPRCPPSSSTDVSRWPPSPPSTCRSQQPFAWWPSETDLWCGATQLPPQGGAPDPGLSPSADQPGMLAIPTSCAKQHQPDPLPCMPYHSSEMSPLVAWMVEPEPSASMSHPSRDSSQASLQ